MRLNLVLVLALLIVGIAAEEEESCANTDEEMVVQSNVNQHFRTEARPWDKSVEVKQRPTPLDDAKDKGLYCCFHDSKTTTTCTTIDFTPPFFFTKQDCLEGLGGLVVNACSDCNENYENIRSVAVAEVDRDSFSFSFHYSDFSSSSGYSAVSSDYKSFSMESSSRDDSSSYSDPDPDPEPDPDQDLIRYQFSSYNSYNADDADMGSYGSDNSYSNEYSYSGGGGTDGDDEETESSSANANIENFSLPLILVTMGIMVFLR